MVKIYKDINANAIFIEDANGVQFLNSLQASQSMVDVDNVNILDLARSLDLVSNTRYDEFIDENDDPYGTNSVDTTNSLNAIFASSGTPFTNIPVITSQLTAELTTGETLNFEMTALYGVGYEWDLTNVPGITTVSGNVRKLIGGSNLNLGTYNIPHKAINYNGMDSETLVLTVSNPPFSNTKSIKFVQNDYLNTPFASNLSTSLGRDSNGSGVSDAWTVSLWFKPGTHTGGAKQTIFYFGDGDHDNGGHIWIYYKGSEQAVYMEYGSKNNFVRLKTSNNSLVLNTWKHLKFRYDGGTTGSSSGSINDYYSRFDISIDNVSQSTSDSNGNFGWSSSIDSNVLQMGKRSGGNDWLKNDCKIDEVYIFDVKSTEDLYNGGFPFDMSTLTTPPTTGYRMGDGDTYPVLNDSFGFVMLLMNNMTSADIVNDVP